MAWEGFVKESKKYMNHPDYWPECNDIKYAHFSQMQGTWWTPWMKRKAAFKFWLAFPRAFVRFYWYTIRDWVRRYV